MKRFLVFFLGVALVVGFSVIPAEAKDLSKRIGIGFTTQAGQILRPVLLIEDEEIPGLPSISAKYGFSETFALGGFLGYRSGTVNPPGAGDIGVSMFAFGVKGYYNAIREDNINIYTGGGIVYSSGKEDNGIREVDTKISGTEFLIFGGSEFFFQGIPNLGFSLELGLDVLISGEIKVEEGEADPVKTKLSGFGTYGDIFGAIGIHYYF